MIKVKKPFEPDNTQAEAVSTYMEVHPEHEEKPLAPYTTSTSEDYHGGEELTFSLPSQFSSSQPASEQSSSQLSTQPSSSQSSLEDSTTENNGSIKVSTSDDESEQSSIQRGQSEWSTESLQEPKNPAEDPESSTDQDSNGVKEENSKETSPDSEDENTSVGITDTEDTETGVEEEDQTPSHVYNTQQAFDIISNTDFNVKYYQTEFYRFLEMIAEEKTKLYDPAGAEEYNVKKLMFKPYEGKPLSHYKMSRVRDTVILILDNSGSMRWWSENLEALAELAMHRNDVKIYVAPNGYIEEMLWPRRQGVSHSEVMKKLKGRRIIYVGDFDGADTPVELSWYNDVVWVCPESRYKHFLQHDWVQYDESEFKGAFIRVFTLEEVFSAFKRVLSNPNPRVWIDLCGEKYECNVYS